jgi:Fe-S-cluster-containing hydrogenase component 2
VIANYGYTDGSGSYYITVNTDSCPTCPGQPCVTTCPESMFIVEPDDYDDDAAMIKREFWKQVKYKCAPCKPVDQAQVPPCIAACPAKAISHSW